MTKEELAVLKDIFNSIKPIEEKSDDGKVIETTVLDTINIAMIGPRAAGKTSLLATLFKYAKENIKPANFEVEIDEDSAIRIKRFNESLQIIKNAENGADVSQKIGSLAPSSGIQTFNFNLKFKKEIHSKKKTVVVVLPFVIKDVPGGLVTDDNKTGIDEFKKHLKESSVLLIPFDSMLYMQKPPCDDKDALDLYNTQHLGIQFINDYCMEWAQNRSEGRDLHPKAVFIAMKSETYHTHKVTETKSNECYTRFRELFNEAIVKMTKFAPSSLALSYTPVETIGCIQCVGSKFTSNEMNHKFIKHNNIPDYLGAGVVLQAIFERAKNHIYEVYGEANKWIDLIKNRSFFEKMTTPWETICAYWEQDKVTDFFNDIKAIEAELDSITSVDSCFKKGYNKTL